MIRIILQDERSRNELIQRVKAIDLSKDKFVAEVKKHRKQRSVSQNNLMHMWFACIAMEEFGHATKDDIEIIKNDCKEQFLPYKIVNYNGKERMILTHTSKLNTKEESDFLNLIDLSAKEKGIKLPYPGEQGYDEFYMEYSKYSRYTD